ncbi:hypothetical protein JL721_9991 [Aureococcus anophagefferens]|nr:hypothetical protein JL721_9991 [Aureococcus anophagefferens]
MDLWVPRDYAHAAAVRAAFGDAMTKLVGVYRPENGCGACTTTPMNSDDQRAWAALDPGNNVAFTSVAGGEPWFMRSAWYNEPNGNYQADCWLTTTWREGWEEGVGFRLDDNQCNICSASYLCSTNQVERIRDEPTPAPTALRVTVDWGGLWAWRRTPRPGPRRRPRSSTSTRPTAPRRSRGTAATLEWTGDHDAWRLDKDAFESCDFSRHRGLRRRRDALLRVDGVARRLGVRDGGRLGELRLRNAALGDAPGAPWRAGTGFYGGVGSHCADGMKLRVDWYATDPTAAPTRDPTPRPTLAPTRDRRPPTLAPTLRPDALPTAASLAPAPAPTPEPTPRPSRAPSPRPTPEPTKRPTPEPTKRPTLEPTLASHARARAAADAKPTKPAPTLTPTPEPTRKIPTAAGGDAISIKWPPGDTYLEVEAGRTVRFESDPGREIMRMSSKTRFKKCSFKNAEAVSSVASTVDEVGDNAYFADADGCDDGEKLHVRWYLPEPSPAPVPAPACEDSASWFYKKPKNTCAKFVTKKAKGRRRTPKGDARCEFSGAGRRAAAGVPAACGRCDAAGDGAPDTAGDGADDGADDSAAAGRSAADVRVAARQQVYRVGDVVLRKGKRWKQDRRTILSDPTYERSILRAYLRDMARDPEWRLLKRLCPVLCRSAFPAPFPHEDHVSVHLRAGDRNAFATANVTRCVDGHLRGGADRTVYVVAVLHFGENDKTGKYFSTPAQIRDGRALVLETIGALRDRGYAVELQSNRSVDYDLCSLERSKHVCLSKGGLDHVVARASWTQLGRHDREAGEGVPAALRRRGDVVVREVSRPGATQAPSAAGEPSPEQSAT